MKKQNNNTGTALSLTPKHSSRRVISIILAVIFMVSMLTVTCFATGTGGTGGTDMWTKATEIMKDVYGKVVGISTIAAVVTAAVALLLMNFSKNGKTVDESRAWLKRIIVSWAILNGLGFIMAYVTPFFAGGTYTV